MTTWEVDTSQFDLMCSQLAAIAQAPSDQVLREEVGKVLSQAISNTDAASVEKIRAHSASAEYTLQPDTLYAPKRKTARKLRRGRVLYNLKWRYPNQLWAAIQKRRADDVKRRIAARGLAKQSWYKLGLLLGLAVEAPDYVKRAVPTTGQTYRDESVDVQQGGSNMAITINTNQPTLTQIGGKQALQRAIDGRSRFFAENVIHDVFKYWWTAAQKYPGVY